VNAGRRSLKAWQANLAVSDADVATLDFANTPEEAVAVVSQKAKGVTV